MTEIKPPTLSEMEDSLAHYGVKGMKWGVRNDGGAGVKTKVKTKAAVIKEKAPTEQMKKAAVGAKVASKKAVDVGAIPFAATAAGLGFPAVALIGMSVTILKDPHVQAAIKSGAQYAAGLVSQLGNTPLSQMTD